MNKTTMFKVYKDKRGDLCYQHNGVGLLFPFSGSNLKTYCRFYEEPYIFCGHTKRKGEEYLYDIIVDHDEKSVTIV